jgi:hypothetical protein
MPGTRAGYDTLSEIAHPNLAGVHGLYAKSDEATRALHFGRGLGSGNDKTGTIVPVLLSALAAFEFAYNRISDEMPGFVAELDRI